MKPEFIDSVTKTLKPHATKAADERGLHVLRIEVRGTEQSPVVEVILDGDRFVKVEDCEAVSRTLGTLLDESKLIPGNPRLDVMSPGTEEPIVLDYQLNRSIGKNVEVHYKDGEESHTVHGKLIAFTNKNVELEPIHPKFKRGIHPKMAGLAKDEQLFVPKVQEILIERDTITNMLIKLEFSR